MKTIIKSWNIWEKLIERILIKPLFTLLHFKNSEIKSTERMYIEHYPDLTVEHITNNHHTKTKPT